MALAGNCSGTKGENVLSVGKSSNAAVTINAGEVIRNQPPQIQVLAHSTGKGEEVVWEHLASCCWDVH